jgi:hypothetical protein
MGKDRGDGDTDDRLALTHRSLCAAVAVETPKRWGRLVTYDCVSAPTW